jgi:hypothetical protein
METINNMSLYIKRAELHHTKEFIMDVFEANSIGIVRDVKFIKKSEITGKEYNGVIVIFERWFMNSRVRQLLDEMSDTIITKFIYDDYNHYWFINIHKVAFPEYEEVTNVDKSLPNEERIIALENLVKSMAVQMHYMQKRQEKTESHLMDCEQKDTRNHLCNVDLRFQLDDKDREIAWAKKDYQDELRKTHEEISNLRCRLACTSIGLDKKDNEIDVLKNKLEECKMQYVPNTTKMSIEELTT